jgi:hypothetical protein
MNGRTTYHAYGRRDGKVWFIELPDLGMATQAKRREQGEDMARDLVALKLDVPPDSFDVVMHWMLDRVLNDAVLRAVTAKARAAAAQAEASNLLRHAVRVATADGMPMRDIGEILGISHQRVAQLLATSAEEPMAAALAEVIGEDDREVEVIEAGVARRATSRDLVATQRAKGGG